MAGMAPRSGATQETAPAAAGPRVEIERKFLVNDLPAGLAGHPSSRIEQGFVAIDPNGTFLRLRRQGGRTLCAIKSGHGLQRTEEEWRIDAERFERLWPLTEGRRVEKQRYRLPASGGLTIELDVYDGDLDGLVTAEVEAPDLETAEAFRPPPWMRVEVTADARYGNARLAVDGIPATREQRPNALLDGEAPEQGWAYVLIEQIDVAAGALRGPGAQEHDKAIHTARKAFKRGRALTRIARDGLDPELADHINVTLRDAGRRLAGTRDAAVVLKTFDDVRERAGGEGAVAQAGVVRSLLEAEQQASAVSASGDAGAIDEVLATLAVLRSELEATRLEGDGAQVLAAGLARIHARGRKRLKVARRAGEGQERTEALHDMRKRTKDLWHAAELLHGAAPKRMERMAEDAHALSDLLGDDHDLAVLAGKLDEHRAAAPEAVEQLEQVLAKRRRKLQRKAMKAAEAIYGSKATGLVAPAGRLGRD